MEAVDSIRRSELCREQSLDFVRVAQVCLSGDDVLGSLGCFWLDDIGEDEVDIGCLWVGEELRGKLDKVSSRPSE